MPSRTTSPLVILVYSLVGYIFLERGCGVGGRSRSTAGCIQGRTPGYKWERLWPSGKKEAHAVARLRLLNSIPMCGGIDSAQEVRQSISDSSQSTSTTVLCVNRISLGFLGENARSAVSSCVNMGTKCGEDRNLIIKNCAVRAARVSLARFRGLRSKYLLRDLNETFTDSNHEASVWQPISGGSAAIGDLKRKISPSENPSTGLSYDKREFDVFLLACRTGHRPGTPKHRSCVYTGALEKRLEPGRFASV